MTGPTKAAKIKHLSGEHGLPFNLLPEFDDAIAGYIEPPHPLAGRVIYCRRALVASYQLRDCIPLGDAERRVDALEAHLTGERAPLIIEIPAGWV